MLARRGALGLISTGLRPRVHYAPPYSAPGSTDRTALGVISPSNRLTMLWYFWMYQRFSLLYLGIATGRTSVPSAFQTHGQVTGVPASCTVGRLSWSSLTLVRVRTRWSFATFRGPPLYAATGKMPSTSGLARYASRMSDGIAASSRSSRQTAAFMAFSRFVAPLSKIGSSLAPGQLLTTNE